MVGAGLARYGALRLDQFCAGLGAGAAGLADFAAGVGQVLAAGGCIFRLFSDCAGAGYQPVCAQPRC